MKRIHRLLLSVLSGILLSLPWLGFPGWILFTAFIPLLILNNFFDKYKHQFPVISFWGHAFLAALIWNVASSWWMARASIAGVGTAMIFNSFLMALVLLLAHSFRRKIGNRLGYIALVTLWISFEYLQFNWDMEWPCLQLGSVLANNIKIIQWYEFTGTFGGSLWILLVNVLLFQLVVFVHKKASVQTLISVVFICAVTVLLPILLSFSMYHSYTENENPVHISIVQPNEDPYLEKYDMEAEKEKLAKFIRLAEGVTTHKTNLLVGPETVFENQWYWNVDKLQSNKFVSRLYDFMQQHTNVELLFGVSTFKLYQNNEDATFTARNKDGIIYDRFNTALFLNRQNETQVYHKSKLVMGFEKAPFQKYFPFFKKLLLDLGGSYGSLGQQKEPLNFEMSNGTLVAPIICVESVFGEYVTEFVKKGAEIVVVITNDGWWKNSRGYKQHLLFSQLRAIETRRSIARAANTGTSCFINQRGEITEATKWWEEAAISGTINTNDKITFYVKHGDYIARGAVFASVLLVLVIFVKRFR